MRIINKNEYSRQFKCNCDTVFEYELSDIIIKGRNSWDEKYSVKCPSCNDEKEIDDLIENEKNEIETIKNNCKSCSECKNLSIIENGYSYYEVTSVDSSCQLLLNKNFPLCEESSNGKREAYIFADKCEFFTRGHPYKKQVEQSKEDALITWARKNK